MPRISNSAVTASSTPVLAVEGNPNRSMLTFTNVGAVTVYIGAIDVSATAFVWLIEANDAVQLFADGVDESARARWYVVTDSSTALVSVGEVVA